MADNTSTAGTAQRTTAGTNGKAPGGTDQLLHFQAGSIHLPPWFVYGLAWTGIGAGLLAHFWQIYTSDLAFQIMTFSNEVFKGMGKSAQAAALPVVEAFCFAIALAAQLGLAFFVFRITEEFKTRKTPSGVSSTTTIKDTAIQVIGHHQILLVWMILAIVIDTIGDYTFITTYVNDPFVILCYIGSLYALSTVLLSFSLQKQWAASVTYVNWKAYKLYMKVLTLKVAESQAKSGGTTGGN